MDNRELFEVRFFDIDLSKFDNETYKEPFARLLFEGWQACAEQKDKEIAALKRLLLKHIKLYRVGDELDDKDAIALSIMYIELDRYDS